MLQNNWHVIFESGTIMKVKSNHSIRKGLNRRTTACNPRLRPSCFGSSPSTQLLERLGVALAGSSASMERQGGVEEGVWEPEARARTSVPASLAANRALTLHPFRSRETPAPRASSGGSGAAPYHGELAEGLEGFCR